MHECQAVIWQSLVYRTMPAGMMRFQDSVLDDMSVQARHAGVPWIRFHAGHPKVVPLAVQPENGQRVFFTEDNVQERTHVPPRQHSQPPSIRARVMHLYGICCTHMYQGSTLGTDITKLESAKCKALQLRTTPTSEKVMH